MARSFIVLKSSCKFPIAYAIQIRILFLSYKKGLAYRELACGQSENVSKA